MNGVKLDKIVNYVIIIILILWNWMVSTKLETPYPELLIELYALPITRIFLLVFVLLAASWCPVVGVLAAFAYACLGADVIFFTQGGQILAATKNTQ
jgi:hypothetical protein